MTLKSLAVDCRPSLKVLKDSPLFAMSRGGKELFHTNFIAFVLEFDTNSLTHAARAVVDGTRDRLLTLLFGSIAPTRVVTWREKSSLDLIIMAAPRAIDVNGKSEAAFDGQSLPMQLIKKQPTEETAGPIAVVVEAKLKALPTKEQLLRYNDKLRSGLPLEFEELQPLTGHIWSKVELILDPGSPGQPPELALAEYRAFRKAMPTAVAPEAPKSKDSKLQTPRFQRFAATRSSLRRLLLSPGDASSVTEGTGWEPLAFRELLAQFPVSEPSDDSLSTKMLWDYADSTRKVLDILDVVKLEVGAYEAGSDETFFDLAKAVSEPEFSRRRIHDLVGKYAFDLARSAVERALKVDTRIPIPMPMSSASGDCRFELHSDTFLSNATAGMSFEWRTPSQDNHGTPEKYRKRVVSVGMQVQGTAFRRFVSASEPNRRAAAGLLGCARLLGDPLAAPTAGNWWRSEIAGASITKTAKEAHGFKCFNESEFLYTGGDIGSLQFEKLVDAVYETMMLARHSLESTPAFGAAARSFLDGNDLGPPAPLRR